MKDMSAVWLSVGAAVVIAVYMTEQATPLWFFLIPAFISGIRELVN